MLVKFVVTFFAVFSSLVTASNLLQREIYEKEFFDHTLKYNLKFKDGEEFAYRLGIFADNYDMITTHNSENHSYTMGLNQFTHLTLSEFHDYIHLGGTRPPNYNLRRNGNLIHAAPADPSTLPASVDWTTAGAVTGVKDQGQCGSCWAFSTTGSLEGAYQIKYNTLKSFSEQELVSCDKDDSGCNGGFMDTAFDWVKKNGGLASEADYAYSSSSGTTGVCKASTAYTNDPLVAPSSYTDVLAGDVTALMSAVAQQPVSIAIQANQIAFQVYSSGVLTGRCGTNLDHGVLAVGYGTWTDGTDYWKVKNSWGPTWGMNGYILIERSASDLCGVLDAASYPNL